MCHRVEIYTSARRCTERDQTSPLTLFLRSTVPDTRFRITYARISVTRLPLHLLQSHGNNRFSSAGYREPSRRRIALDSQTGMVECVITIATLEAYFWLEPQASDARILKTFRDGFDRIRAIASRKLLAHPSRKLELTPQDFARR